MKDGERHLQMCKKYTKKQASSPDVLDENDDAEIQMDSEFSTEAWCSPVNKLSIQSTSISENEVFRVTSTRSNSECEVQSNQNTKSDIDGFSNHDNLEQTSESDDEGKSYAGHDNNLQLPELSPHSMFLKQKFKLDTRQFKQRNQALIKTKVPEKKMCNKISNMDTEELIPRSPLTLADFSSFRSPCSPYFQANIRN